MVSDVCLSVAYIGPNSRTERPRKTKIDTEVAHVTRVSNTTVKVNVKWAASKNATVDAIICYLLIVILQRHLQLVLTKELGGDANTARWL